MATSGGPNTTTEGLVFGYDTGYPLVSGSHETYKFNKGEPTTTFDIGTMLPSSPRTFFISNDIYDSNIHGTVWDWSYYPNDTISSDGGMEWLPDYEGPGFVGAWKMKKRAGGNSESNFSGTAPGSIDADKDYTVSVWCKTDQASCFRIHLNTTKDGSSYWGYASGYHSGNDTWERLSVTIPSGSLNTSLNTIRFQAIGTTVNADAYCRDYQVEQRDHATPFILGGSRSVSGSLIDLTRTHDIDLSNVSFNTNAQLSYDGTDDYLEVADHNSLDLTTAMSFEFVVKANSTQNNLYPRLIDKSIYLIHLSQTSPFSIAQNITTSGGLRQTAIGSAFTADTWTHIVCNYDGQYGKIYVNGELVKTSDFSSELACSTNSTSLKFGGNGTSDRVLNGELPLAKVYNKVLTAEEVKQNYNAMKNRFNI